MATLRAEPLATLGGLARDGLAQLWHLSVDDVPLTAANAAFAVAQRVIREETTLEDHRQPARENEPHGN